MVGEEGVIRDADPVFVKMSLREVLLILLLRLLLVLVLGFLNCDLFDSFHCSFL